MGLSLLGGILIFIGIAVTAITIIAAAYLAFLACVMLTSACSDNPISLFVELMFSDGSIPFWIGIAIGALLIWQGRRIRARSLSRVEATQ